MIKADDLDGIKLVTEENNFASDDDTLNVLEAAFMQGSQGWGVTKDTAILLRMARVLYVALKMAETADENARLLKGAQMELGRVKKQRDTLKTSLDSDIKIILELTERVSEVEKYNVDLAAENVALNDVVPPR